MILMELIYEGKTKNLYALEDGNYMLKFKDDVTGEDGVFDPGANDVGLTMEGAGKAGLRLTKLFFERLEKEGIPTHFVEADIEERTMTVMPAEVFGDGLEVICRYKAVGSFYSRYGTYLEKGQPLDTYVEMTLKDDERGDPLITKDALEMLGILSVDEYERIKELTKEIAEVVKDELGRRGLELYDIKFEFGKLEETGEIVLIDEISGGNMRAFKDGEHVKPLELAEIMLEE